MKVSELSGFALDWAVAKAIGEYRPVAVPAYSTDWTKGGPIIEREELSRLRCYGTNQWECLNGEIVCEGATPLIAAMRCYVASKLGEEITVPEAYLETSN